MRGALNCTGRVTSEFALALRVAELARRTRAHTLATADFIARIRTLALAGVLVTALSGERTRGLAPPAALFRPSRAHASRAIVFEFLPTGTRLHTLGGSTSLRGAHNCTGRVTSDFALALRVAELARRTRAHTLATADFIGRIRTGAVAVIVKAQP